MRGHGTKVNVVSVGSSERKQYGTVTREK